MVIGEQFFTVTFLKVYVVITILIVQRYVDLVKYFRSVCSNDSQVYYDRCTLILLIA